MKKILNFLNGKKTILGILVGAIYSIAISLGWVDNNEYIWTAIVAWTGVSFRLAQKK